MRFDDLDKEMRLFETAHDVLVLPGIHCVIRLDGRGFTKLTERMHAVKPFDIRFQAAMRETTETLMKQAGLKFLYGYHQSDEISLLLHPDETSFNRKERKLNSLLASEASVAFSFAVGQKAIFDARVCQLPTMRNVIDYFRWRQEDATRNCLNGYCYWKLREEGKTARQATSMLTKRSVADKNELLFQRGVNFNDIPAWEKRGTGMRWFETPHEGFNPKTKQIIPTTRQTLEVETVLPFGDPYSRYIADLLGSACRRYQAPTRASMEELQRLLNESRREEYSEGVNAEHWYGEYQKLKREVLDTSDLKTLQARHDRADSSHTR